MCEEDRTFTMSQHFLLSPAAKTLSLASVFRMSDAEAEAMGRRGRKAACELYNWNSEERVLLKFYSALLEPGAPEKKESPKPLMAAVDPQPQYQGQVPGVAPYS